MKTTYFQFVYFQRFSITTWFIICIFHSICFTSLNSSKSSRKLNLKCDEPEINVLWGRDVGHSALASSPVVKDIDGDGLLEVVGASLVDTVIVLHSHNGQVPAGTKWPQQHSGSAVLASPLLHDVNRDGKEEILIITSDAHLIFYDATGELLNQTIQLPSLQIDKDWWKKAITVEKINVHDYILDEVAVDGKTREGYINVDAHVLATPILVDLNRDNVIEELIIPTSYFLEPDLVSHNSTENEENLAKSDKYLAGSLVLMNLTTMEILRTIHLELTEVDSEFPGYLLNTPTVVDLDSNGGDLEIIVGTSGGDIHVVDMFGKQRRGFPVPRDTMHTQVVVDDINGDGVLELVAMDISSNIAAFHPDGSILWETELRGSGVGIRFGDVNGDGNLDVVVATDDGHLWALSGKDGVVLENWPFRVGRSLRSAPLLTHITNRDSVDLTSLPDDAHLHILSNNVKCRRAISLGEVSYASLVSHDLMSHIPGLELLVATSDGMLLCLGQHLEKGREFNHGDLKRAVLDGFHSETQSPNGFTFHNSKFGVYIERETGNVIEVVGGTFSLNFEIVNTYLESPNDIPYTLNLYFGSVLISTHFFTHSGKYSLNINSPLHPKQGILQLVLINHHGQIFRDSVAIRFNMTFHQDLKWVLLSPFIAMATILLFKYGFPAADLLPMTFSNKER